MKIIFIIFLVIVVIFSSFELYTRSQIKSGKYPDVFVESFMSSCKIGKENCQCVLDYLQNNFSYKKYQSLNDLENTTALEDASAYCKKNADLPQ